MSHLVEIDPSTEIPLENPGCEFGYYLFESLPPISMEEVCNVDDIPLVMITDPDENTLTYLVPKDPGGDTDRLLALIDGEHYEVINSLQDQDTYCHHILNQIRKGKIPNNQLYKVESDILK